MSFSEAIDTIDKKESHPLIVEETIPRKIETARFFWFAIITMLTLVFAQFYTAWGVRRAHE